MTYTKPYLKQKSKNQLIDIVLRLQNKKPNTKFDMNKHFVIADGTKGMTRGE